MQQGQQNRGHRRSGGVVEGAVDGVQYPHPRRVDGRAAELLAVHLDSGGVDQRGDDLSLDRKVDFGGEVVALLGHRRVGAVAGQERLGRSVEDRRCLGDQCVQIHCGLLSHRGQRLRQGESPGVEGLAHDGALDPAVGESG